MHNSPSQSSPLLSNLSSIITTQGYISPSNENLSFLMNSSPTIKNLLTFSLNALSNYNSLKQAKSSLSFYTLYQDKIQQYHNLKQTKENKLKELQSKRQVLLELKSKKAELLSTNRSLLSTINAHSNKETFSNIKAKILSLGQLKVTSLLKQLINFAALENVKYDHCYFGKDYHNKAITTQNTIEFDINQHLQNTSHELSIINNDSLLSNVNDTTSQPVPLPKLSIDDVMKYTPITQEAYAKEIQQKLRVLMQHKASSLNNDDAISLSTCSNNNNCINDITNTFKDIVNAVITDIQKEEERISLQYNETAETYNDAIASTQSENKTLITIHNIPQAHIQIIKQLTLGKIFKDLSRSYQQFNDVADEFELPKCFISKDTPLKFAHLANIIKTYKKLLMRTDGFILKRLLPLGVCLEDKCTDMWNVIHTENDYFIKMNYNTFTNNNNNTICDINDYKYDKHILKEFNVYSKYDIYTYFCKYLYHYKYMNTCNTNIKRKTDLIYNNKHYQTYLKQSKDTLKEVETFIKGVNYNQEYKLMYNKSLIPQMEMLINEFKDIKPLQSSLESVLSNNNKQNEDDNNSNNDDNNDNDSMQRPQSNNSIHSDEQEEQEEQESSASNIYDEKVKEKAFYLANISLQLGNIEDAVHYAEEMTTYSETMLDKKQQKILLGAFNLYLVPLRTSWRQLCQYETEEKVAKKMINEIKLQKEEKIKNTCEKVIKLISEFILKKKLTDKEEALFTKVKADHYRYMAEITTGHELYINKQNAFNCYKEAYTKAEHFEDLDATKLNIALNYSVFLYEILNKRINSFFYAKEALYKALRALKDCNEEELTNEDMRDTLMIIEVLNKNVEDWYKEEVGDIEGVTNDGGKNVG